MGYFDFLALSLLYENNFLFWITGLLVVQRRRLLKSVESAFTDKPATMYAPSESGDRNNQKIMIRYLFCQNMYEKEVHEQAIQDLDPQAELEVLHYLIQKKENLKSDLMLEFYSHEGYPFNANVYSLKCMWYLIFLVHPKQAIHVWMQSSIVCKIMYLW